MKRHWPHPYLEKVKVGHYVLPTLKDMWQGNKAAPEYEANRREVLGRAKGKCERCGRATKLVVHHRYRVQWRKTPKNADHRPENMEALCQTCHDNEHRAEMIYRLKQIPSKMLPEEVKQLPWGSTSPYSQVAPGGGYGDAQPSGYPVCQNNRPPGRYTAPYPVRHGR